MGAFFERTTIGKTKIRGGFSGKSAPSPIFPHDFTLGTQLAGHNHSRESAESANGQSPGGD